MSLTNDQKAIIKATVPILASQGTEITRHFYTTLFIEYPSLKSLFSHSTSPAGNSHQPAALAASLYAYATHIDDLTPILPVVEKICQKHASLDITAEQYSIVGEGLLRAMRNVLGADVFTDEVKEAWGVAYWDLAGIMTDREEEIMSGQTEVKGGWRGWRDMKCVKRVQESKDVVSFYWTPVDGGALPSYKSGQYISLRIEAPVLGEGVKQIRQYSLSDAPPATEAVEGEKNNKSNGMSNGATNGHTSPTTTTTTTTYRTTTRRDPGAPSDLSDPSSLKHPGYVSNLLHDTIQPGSVVEMTHPAGDFFLDSTVAADTSTPVVLISAGVGLTPLMSMLQTLLEQQEHTTDNATKRPISWIHVARNKSLDPFANDVAQITKTNPNVVARVYHSTPQHDEVKGTDYDRSGRPDLRDLSDEEKKELLFFGTEEQAKATYFMCGPEAFMVGAAKALKGMCVDADRVKMELFGAGAIPA